MLASRRVATRISRRFARKKAKNDDIRPILPRLEPFIYKPKRKTPTDRLGFSLRLLDYQEDLVIPASLEHGRREFRRYRNSQDRLEETTTGGDQLHYEQPRFKKKEPDRWSGSIRGFGLPRRLGDTWKLALVSHVAEANTRNTELCEESTWTTIDCVTSANANW